MDKIEIKLKNCCLTCEHFDASGIQVLGYGVISCFPPKRIIACGHREVCKKYLEAPENETE